MKLRIPILAISVLAIIFTNKAYAQSPSKSGLPNNQTITTIDSNPDYVRCSSIEMNDRRMSRLGVQDYDQNFENWIAPFVQQRLLDIENGISRRAVVYVPIIFHVITSGSGPTNLSDAIIQSQIDQLNLDFSDQGGVNGVQSSYSQSADAEIVFVAATTDPDGNPLAVAGVDRVTEFGAGPFSRFDFDLGDGGQEIKPATIWDRSQYANVWTADISGGILGYAQFPSNSTLPGLNTNGGSALNDGVVCGYGTIGSRDMPGSSPPYNLGRTLTHEVGHWIGLRHIWGDGNCSVDDFVNDTPNSSAANYGCSNPPSCSSADMVENYMDYTDDSCMELFTAGQVARIDTVLDLADGISELPNSTTADPVPPTIFFPNKTLTVVEGSGCGSTDFMIPVSLLPDGPSTLAVATMSVDSGTATNGVDFEIMTSSLSFSQNVTGSQNLILRVFEDGFVEGDETISISFSVNANGGNAIAGVNNVLDVTITDDDNVTGGTTAVTLFEDDFESYNDFIISNIGGWTLIDNDGDSTYGSDNTNFTNENYTGSFIVFNPQATTPASNPGWNAFAGDKGFYCFNSTGNVSGTIENDDYAITPQINNGTNGVVTLQARSLTTNYAGGERFQVGVSLTNDGTGITYLTPSPYVVPPLTWTEYSYNIPSSFDNQSLYVLIHVVSADEFVFMLDDIEVKANVEALVQTDVNTLTSYKSNMLSSGTVYATDNDTGNTMANVSNNDGFNYGCIDVAVTRSGQGAQQYDSSSVSDYAMDKSFTITTDNTTSTGNTSVSFYFTEGEISGWESVTGNLRSSIVAYRVNGNEIVAMTLNNVAGGITLTGNFSGLDSAFFFGITQSFNSGTLDLDDNILSKVKIYPNPTNSLVNIEGLQNIDVIGIELFSITGKQVKTNSNTASKIDLSPLVSGVYFLRIQTKEGSSVFKVLKN